ncbi:MAG TPA: DUF2064 domain-containing protein, partial [Candidatus Deferrimicrobium sp.]
MLSQVVKDELKNIVGEGRYFDNPEDLLLYSYDAFMVPGLPEAAMLPVCTEEVSRRFDRHDFIPQVGGDVGERMKNTFRRCFADGFDDVVLIGSDIPDLPAAILAEAFEGITWGTERVLRETLEPLAGGRRDLSSPDAHLAGRGHTGGHPGSHSAATVSGLLRHKNLQTT